MFAMEPRRSIRSRYVGENIKFEQSIALFPDQFPYSSIDML